MILEKINSPSDLKGLSLDELTALAQEIRERIISVVAKRGGHLASSLGAVELIIALHKVYNTPEDKIIWDVGHQAYAHKIITGRNKDFDALREKDGISGFPSHWESEYDVFTVGHSSTAVSLAMGLALGRDLNNQDYKIVAIIGDGSLSGGMCFEALNHAGHLQSDILVVLNSNNMAISAVQGALSRYVNRIISTPTYNRVHNKIREVILKIPAMGKSIARFGAKLEEALKGLIVPGWLFEELGFRYFGPIDGHDLATLISTLQAVKDLPGPKLLHVITQKGKGYKYAENDPTTFHGVMKFDVDTGKVDRKQEKSFTKAFSEIAGELFDKDKNVVGITAAMLDGTGLKPIAERWPERVFDVGIAEEHAVTLSAGLSKAGKIPIVAIYSTFLQRAYDQIICDVALQDVGVIFAIDRAGIVGEDGVMHHGLMDITFLRSIPKLTLLVPRNELMLKQCFLWAYQKAKETKRPVAIRYPKDKVPLPLLNEPVEIIGNRGHLLYNTGDDFLILCLGPMIYDIIDVVDELHLKAKVVDPIFASVLDQLWLKRLAEPVKLIYTFEEGVKRGGFGEYIATIFSGEKKVIPVGIENHFVFHGNREELLRQEGLDKEGIKKLLCSQI